MLTGEINMPFIIISNLFHLKHCPNLPSRSGIEKSLKPAENERLHKGVSIGRPNVCSTCVDQEVYKNLTITEIKKHILKQLNMNNGPPMIHNKVFDKGLMNRLVGQQGLTRMYSDHYRNQQFNFERVENSFNAILAQKREYIATS